MSVGPAESAFLASARGSTAATERAVARNLPMGQPEISNINNVLGTREGQVASLMYAASRRAEPGMQPTPAPAEAPPIAPAAASAAPAQQSTTLAQAARRLGADGYDVPVARPRGIT